MGRIPNYLRTTTNKYKGLITEKVALNYLRKRGFVCKRLEYIVLMAEHLEKHNWEQEKERYKRDLKKYSSKSPPKGFKAWRGEVELTWEEYRKEQIELSHQRISNLPRRVEEEREFERIWGAHLEPIKNFDRWLRGYRRYPRYPDFVAKRGNKIFIVEVKSQSRGKTAFFGEHQKEALLKAYDFGLTPLLLIVPLNLNIEIEEPQLKEIEKSPDS